MERQAAKPSDDRHHEMLETPIEMASRHVIEGDIRCSRQGDLIGRMRDRGLDTVKAENLLNLLEDCLTVSYAHLSRLVEQLFEGAPIEKSFAHLRDCGAERGRPRTNGVDLSLLRNGEYVVGISALRQTPT